MTSLDFEKTPKEKLAHVEANFGCNSLYAVAMRNLVRIAGKNPSAEKLGNALTIVEQQVNEYLEVPKLQS